MPTQKLKSGLALQPIKMRIHPLKPRNLMEVPQDRNRVYQMMQQRIEKETQRVRGPEITRSLHQLSNPIDRVDNYRKVDY